MNLRADLQPSKIQNFHNFFHFPKVFIWKSSVQDFTRRRRLTHTTYSGGIQGKTNWHSEATISYSSSQSQWQWQFLAAHAYMLLSEQIMWNSAHWNGRPRWMAWLGVDVVAVLSVRPLETASERTLGHFWVDDDEMILIDRWYSLFSECVSAREEEEERGMMTLVSERSLPFHALLLSLLIDVGGCICLIIKSRGRKWMRNLDRSDSIQLRGESKCSGKERVPQSFIHLRFKLKANTVQLQLSSSSSVHPNNRQTSDLIH